MNNYAGVAHLGERQLPKLKVAGSIPVARFLTVINFISGMNNYFSIPSLAKTPLE